MFHYQNASCRTPALVSLVSLGLLAATSLSAATLQHHWTFDEGSGSVVADSVGNADMSIQGTNTAWTTGKVGSAYAFNGTNHAATNTNDQVTNPSGAVAIAGWFRTAANTANRSYLFQIEREYGMRIRNGQLQLSFQDNVSTAPSWGSELDDGLWHHFVAQNNGTTTELYVDGQLVGSRSETLNGLNGESKNSAIAAKQSGASKFAGSFDDFRYYEGTLTSAEIQTLALVADQPPRATEDTYTAGVNTQLVVAAPGVLANDSESDGDAVRASLVEDAGLGTLHLSADGGFTYDPPSGFVGVTEFTYQAVDADGVSNTATVTLTILDPASSLTPEEVAKIETDLGVTLSSQEILDLSSLVKPQSLPTWRSDANARIESHRKADLTIEVVDSVGTPVPGASVHLALRKHTFKFGGVVTVMDLTDADGNLSGAGFNIEGWKQLTKALFNTVGLNNGFKPKITSQHQYIPGFMSWAGANDLDVRGHLLVWPGGGDLEDLDNPEAVSGVHYGNHLSRDTTSSYASYDVLGAVDMYKASARDQAAKDALESVVDAEITEWASQWDVYEWDVVNETIGNTLLQEILGYDQMAEWFHIAEAKKLSPETDLYINDFQVISGQFEAGSTQYTTRRDTYFSRIDRVIADGGPMTGIGFQSRFKYGHIPPSTVYARLEEFATRYPTMKLAGTEFEIKDWYDFNTGSLIAAYDETLRAQMTEEILTTYFSHPNVIGMNAWDFMNPENEAGDPTTSRALCYYDGTVKLNGLVWYYLHRIRYSTDLTNATAANGQVTLRGFKGDYDLTVSYGGSDYPATLTLLADGSTQVQLNDVTLSTAPTEKTIEYWLFDDATDTAFDAVLNSEGSAIFNAAVANVKTDGAGALRITQSPTFTDQFSGDFIAAEPLSMGARSKGTYELEFIIAAADLSTGDPNGATVGFGIKDSVADEELFLVRLNKTVGGLAVSTYIDTTYTQIQSFNGQFSLSQPLKIRSVIDLDSGTADIYTTVGVAAEVFQQQVSLSATATNWDQVLFASQNNQTDWGSSDYVEVDYLKFRKLQVDNYALWSERVDWGGETLTEPGDNPDGDRLVNVLEYALGGNPLVDDAAEVYPRVQKIEGLPYYTFLLGVDSLDIDLEIQHSPDLIDWTSLPATPVKGQNGQLIQIPLIDAGIDQRFSRLKVAD